MIIYYFNLAWISIIGALESPIAALPDVALPSYITTSIATVLHWLGLVWSAIPYTLSALLSAIGVIIVVENNIAIYKVVRWIYSKIPGIN